MKDSVKSLPRCFKSHCIGKKGMVDYGHNRERHLLMSPKPTYCLYPNCLQILPYKYRERPSGVPGICIFHSGSQSRRVSNSFRSPRGCLLTGYSMEGPAGRRGRAPVGDNGGMAKGPVRPGQVFWEGTHVKRKKYIEKQ